MSSGTDDGAAVWGGGNLSRTGHCKGEAAGWRGEGWQKAGRQQEVLRWSPEPLSPEREGGGMTGAGATEILCHSRLTYVLRNFLSGSWWVSKYSLLLPGSCSLEELTTEPSFYKYAGAFPRRPGAQSLDI